MEQENIDVNNTGGTGSNVLDGDGQCRGDVDHRINDEEFCWPVESQNGMIGGEHLVFSFIRAVRVFNTCINNSDIHARRIGWTER